jgi:hypothetical protein
MKRTSFGSLVAFVLCPAAVMAITAACGGRAEHAATIASASEA